LSFCFKSLFCKTYAVRTYALTKTLNCASSLVKRLCLEKGSREQGAGGEKHFHARLVKIFSFGLPCNALVGGSASRFDGRQGKTYSLTSLLFT